MKFKFKIQQYQTEAVENAANDNVIDNFEQIFKAYSEDTARKIL